MEGGERGEEGWGRKGGRGRVGEEGGKNAACMKVRGGTCMLPTVSLDSPDPQYPSTHQKMLALAAPLLSSRSWTCVLVSYTLIKVPYRETSHDRQVNTHPLSQHGACTCSVSCKTCGNPRWNSNTVLSSIVIVLPCSKCYIVQNFHWGDIIPIHL